MNPLRSRTFSIALLLALHPALYLWGQGGPIYPDTVTYLAFARNLVDTGSLMLPGWGHVNAGFLLPPLYPVLIAAVKPLTGDPVTAAYLVSRLALVATTVPIFLLVDRVAGRMTAFVGTAAIQLTQVYLVHGFMPLTEALFLLATFATLLALVEVRRARRPVIAGIGIGIAAASVFLARQIGLAVIAFALVWLTVRAFSRVQHARRSLLGAASALVLVIGAYTALVWGQAGTHPFHQHVTMAQYEPGLNPDFAAGVVKMRTRRLDAAADYSEVIALRRQFRQLLPDGSEMYGEVRAVGDGEAGALDRGLAALARPRAWLGRIGGNLGHLRESLGASLLILLLLTTASAALLARPGRPGPALLPGLLAGWYLLLVSLLTDRVDRYVTVVAPLLLVQIVIGAGLALQWALGQRSRPVWAMVVAAAMTALIIPSELRSVEALPKGPVLPAAADPGVVFQGHVSPGDGVYALHPWPAYVAGGTYRLVPNDSLERVVAYGRRTGVKWLLVTPGRATAAELAMNRNLSWFRRPDLHLLRPDLVRLAAVSEDGLARLYRIRGGGRTDGS